MTIEGKRAHFLVVLNRNMSIFQFFPRYLCANQISTLLQAILLFSHLLIRGLIKGLSTFLSFSIEICQFFSFLRYFGLNQLSTLLQTILLFSHLLIRGLMKGLSTNWVFYSTLFIKIYCYIMHDSSTPLEAFLKSIFKFSHLLIRGLIKGLSSN